MSDLTASFRALGDPTRLRILRLLLEAPLNVSELVSLVGVAQPSVSHHLAKLKGLGLIQEERQAGFSVYSLAVGSEDARWPLMDLTRRQVDLNGDGARLKDLLRQREDRQLLNERLLEPGQSWSLWAGALASLLPPLEVADFGCGTGALCASMARWARRVVAIDANADVLGQAKARAAREGLKNVAFLNEDLHHLSLPSGKQDWVVISQSLHHVKDPAAVVREAARLLRTGGKVAVLELMPHRESWVQERLGHRHLGFEPAALEAILKQAGFAQVQREAHARNGESPFRVFRLSGVKR